MPTTYKIVTVNDAPEKATPLFEAIRAQFAEKYDLVFAGNAASPADVTQAVTEYKPDLLFTASMWTEEEAQKAVADAKAVDPNLKTFSLPHGLQKEKGPQGVIGYINENLPAVLG